MIDLHQEILKSMRASPVIISQLVAGLDDEQIRQRPAAAEWAVIVGAFYYLLHAVPATAGLSLTDAVIVLGFVSLGSIVQIPGVGGGIQIVTVLVLTQFYGIALEAASGIALLWWIVGFVTIVPIGLILAFHEGIKWRSLRHINPADSL